MSILNFYTWESIFVFIDFFYLIGIQLKISHIYVIGTLSTTGPILLMASWNIVTKLIHLLVDFFNLSFVVNDLYCKYLFNWCVCLDLVFRVCGIKNIVGCLVIYQTAFYIVEPIKKLSLKYSFCEVVFTYFLTEFRKTLFFFAFQKHFFQNLNFFIFFFTSNYFFFVFSYHFNTLISKIIFKK